MYKVDQTKWQEFPAEVQMKNIAVEISRATEAALHSEKSDKEWIKAAYERALILIDACLDDPKREDKKALYDLRDAVAALYAGDVDPAVAKFIQNKLLE